MHPQSLSQTEFTLAPFPPWFSGDWLSPHFKSQCSQPRAAICFPFYRCEGITCYFRSIGWRQNYCCYATKWLWRKRSRRHFDGHRKSVNDGIAAVTAPNLLCTKEHSSCNLKLWNFIKRDQGVEEQIQRQTVLAGYFCKILYFFFSFFFFLLMQKKRPHCLGCFLAALYLSNHLARLFPKVASSMVTGKQVGRS